MTPEPIRSVQFALVLAKQRQSRFYQRGVEHGGIRPVPTRNENRHQPAPKRTAVINAELFAIDDNGVPQCVHSCPRVAFLVVGNSEAGNEISNCDAGGSDSSGSNGSSHVRDKAPPLGVGALLLDSLDSSYQQSPQKSITGDTAAVNRSTANVMPPFSIKETAETARTSQPTVTPASSSPPPNVVTAMLTLDHDVIAEYVQRYAEIMLRITYCSEDNAANTGASTDSKEDNSAAREVAEAFINMSHIATLVQMSNSKYAYARMAGVQQRDEDKKNSGTNDDDNYDEHWSGTLCTAVNLELIADDNDDDETQPHPSRKENNLLNKHSLLTILEEDALGYAITMHYACSSDVAPRRPQQSLNGHHNARCTSATPAAHLISAVTRHADLERQALLQHLQSNAPAHQPLLGVLAQGNTNVVLDTVYNLPRPLGMAPDRVGETAEAECKNPNSVDAMIFSGHENAGEQAKKNQRQQHKSTQCNSDHFSLPIIDADPLGSEVQKLHDQLAAAQHEIERLHTEVLVHREQTALLTEEIRLLRLVEQQREDAGNTPAATKAVTITTGAENEHRIDVGNHFGSRSRKPLDDDDDDRQVTLSLSSSSSPSSPTSRQNSPLPRRKGKTDLIHNRNRLQHPRSSNGCGTGESSNQPREQQYDSHPPPNLPSSSTSPSSAPTSVQRASSCSMAVRDNVLHRGYSAAGSISPRSCGGYHHHAGSLLTMPGAVPALLSSSSLSSSSTSIERQQSEARGAGTEVLWGSRRSIGSNVSRRCSSSAGSRASAARPPSLTASLQGKAWLDSLYSHQHVTLLTKSIIRKRNLETLRATTAPAGDELPFSLVPPSIAALNSISASGGPSAVPSCETTTDFHRDSNDYCEVEMHTARKNAFDVHSNGDASSTQQPASRNANGRETRTTSAKKTTTTLYPRERKQPNIVSILEAHKKKK